MNISPETAARFWIKVDRSQYSPGGCWPWLAGRSSTGYGGFKLAERQYGAHRMAYVLTYGELPPGMWARHICGNRWCCNPAHLLPGTAGDNNRDTVQQGRHNPWPGSRIGPRKRAKLTYAEAQEIRQRYAAGCVRYIDLAEMFDVCDTTIYAVVKNLTWRHE